MEVSLSKKRREGLIKIGGRWGFSTSQGTELSVIVHVIKKLVIAHCIAYRTNLVVPTLFSGETCEGSFGNIVFLLQLLPSNAPLSSQS